MKDRLVIDERRGGCRIVWWLAEDRDYGAALGESGAKPSNPQNEMEAAEAAVWDMADGREAFGGLRWNSRLAAQRALKIAKQAVAEFEGAKPWPEWAKQALAAGWKAPKGWTP